LETLEQVIEFVATLNTQDAQRVANELSQINQDRVAEAVQGEETMVEAARRAAADRMQLASQELEDFEDALTSKVEKELAQIERLQEANEKRYELVLAKANEAQAAQIELVKALTDKEIAEYQRAERNKDIIDARRKEVLQQQEREAGGGGMGGFMQRMDQPVPGQRARAGIGGAIGFIASTLPNVTEQDKQTRIGAETLEATLKSKTPMEALLNVSKGILKWIKLSYEEETRRRKEVLVAAGGTLQFRSAEQGGVGPGGETGPSLDQLKLVRELLEKNSTILRDNFKMVDATLTEMGRARPVGVGQIAPGMQGASEQMRLMLKVSESADLLGANWAKHARNIGDMSRKEVDARTGATMSFEEGIHRFNQAFDTAQRVAIEFGGIDIQRFVTNWQQLHDSLRPFGFTMEDTLRYMSRFGRALDRGIVSLNDLVQWATGMTRADDASRAFMFEQLLEFTATKPELRDIHGVLTQAREQGPIAQSFVMEALAEGNIQALGEVGITGAQEDPQGERFRQSVRDMINQMATDFPGQEGSALRRRAEADYFLRTFGDPTAGVVSEGRTIEARELLRAGGVDMPEPDPEKPAKDLADKLVPPLNESIKELQIQTQELRQIRQDLRKRELGPMAAQFIEPAPGTIEALRIEHLETFGVGPGGVQMGPGGVGNVGLSEEEMREQLEEQEQVWQRMQEPGASMSIFQERERASQAFQEFRGRVDVNVNVPAEGDWVDLMNAVKENAEATVRQHMDAAQKGTQQRAIEGLQEAANASGGVPKVTTINAVTTPPATKK